MPVERTRQVGQLLADLGRVLLQHPRQVRHAPNWLFSRLPAAIHTPRVGPWVCYDAKSWLDRRLIPKLRLFEWGSGSSTLYFASIGCHVTSVEHDGEWANWVQRELNSRSLQDRVDLLFVPPDPQPIAGDSVSGHPDYLGISFSAYVDAIKGEVYDGIIIDGRARSACLNEATKHIHSRGFIFLDDSQRSRYQMALSKARESGFQSTNFSGLAPGKPGVNHSVVLERHTSCLAF